MANATTKSRFLTLAGRIFGVSGAEAAWETLGAGYGGTERAYHNWSHIVAMLNGLDEAKAVAEFSGISFHEVELAIFFHDAVYDPRIKDNEEKSAALLHQMSGIGFEDRESVRRAAEMILATAKHEASSDPATRLLLDLDLRVLGGPPEQYRAYAGAVRAEYSFVPDQAWRDGRSAVLRRFLDRERIFQTDHFGGRHERQARENIAAELDTLALT
jgi:predicted metal-dependent HD superfamily phosphohydrolase